MAGYIIVENFTHGSERRFVDRGAFDTRESAIDFLNSKIGAPCDENFEYDNENDMVDYMGANGIYYTIKREKIA